MLCALLYPCIIVPLMLVYIDYDTGGKGTQFSGEAIGVGLFYRVVVETRVDCILVQGPRFYARHKALPDSQLLVTQPHRVSSTLPTIEIPNNRDCKGIRRPYSKVNARYAVHHAYMRSHFLIDAIIFSLPKQVKIKIAKNGWRILLCS